MDYAIISKLADTGFVFAPTAMGMTRSNREGWPQLATSDKSTLLQWIEEGNNLVSVAKRGHGFAIDIDDVKAVLAKGFRMEWLDGYYLVNTPSGGIHGHALHTRETEALGNLVVVYEVKGDTKSKKIFELKLNNQSVAAPTAIRRNQPKKKDGVYQPHSEFNGARKGLPPEMMAWIKENAETPKAPVKKVNYATEFHPEFSLDDFLEYHDCTEHDSGEVDGAFHVVVETCPVCGKEANDSTLRAGITKFILGGHGFGFVCHACGIDSREDLDTKMDDLYEDWEPWSGFIYRHDDQALFVQDALSDEKLQVEFVSFERVKDDEDDPNVNIVTGCMSETVIDIDPLAFPKEAMYGRLGQMAHAMAMPLGLAYPALIGTYSVMPDVDEMSDTRINCYVILLAAPGGGKNLAIKRALAMVNPPNESYKKSAPVSDRGLMSLIGHKVEKKSGGKKEVTPGPKKLLLVTNEAANVLKKANIKNSSLGATLCEVWDENEYAPADRNGEQQCDCRLSWLGGLPIKREHPEEFGEYFGREAGRGLLSRTILGFSDVKFNYKPWKAPDIWGSSDDETLDELVFGQAREAELTDECFQMLDAWEPTDEEEAGRFKYNAKKVALLSASANGDKLVTRECMQAAIEFAKWQERLRQVFTIGVAAENCLEAQFTEAFLTAMRQKGGQTKYLGWRRLAHDRKWEERFGPRIVNTTVENLIKSGTLEPHTYLAEDEEGNKFLKTNPNKVKLRDWNA